MPTLGAAGSGNGNRQGAWEREMKSIRAVSAALIALGIGMTGSASALPQTPAPRATISSPRSRSTVMQDVRRHYVPEYDRRVWHRHRQSNCRVDPRRSGRRFEDRPRDCHRDVRRHYLPEYGRSVYHKHVGERCRIRVYNPYEGNRPGGRLRQARPGPALRKLDSGTQPMRSLAAPVTRELADGIRAPGTSFRLPVA